MRSYHREQWSLSQLVMKRKCYWLRTIPRSPNKATVTVNQNMKVSTNADPGTVSCATYKMSIYWLILSTSIYRKLIDTYTNDADITGVLRTSYMAIRPLYDSSTLLNDTANRSPVALQAIFSMHSLHISNKCSGTCLRLKKKDLKTKQKNRMEKHYKIYQLEQKHKLNIVRAPMHALSCQFMRIGGRYSDTIWEKELVQE